MRNLSKRAEKDMNSPVLEKQRGLSLLLFPPSWSLIATDQMFG